MKIIDEPTIVCGVYYRCKDANDFPCTDCFHKIPEKGDLDKYSGDVIE